jgi:hypothetical protein
MIKGNTIHKLVAPNNRLSIGGRVIVYPKTLDIFYFRDQQHPKKPLIAIDSANSLTLKTVEPFNTESIPFRVVNA